MSKMNRKDKTSVTPRPVLLHLDGDVWRLGSVGPRGLVLRELDADVAALSQGGRGPRLAVALASGRWLCGGISTADLPRRDRREAMLYRLEEKLPVAAEDLAAAFVETGGRAMGVATDADALRGAIGPLAAAGVRVACVAPMALLALQGKPADPQTHVVIWQHGEEAEVIGVEAGRPTSWATLAADADDLNLYLQLVHDADRPRVELRNCSAALLLALAEAEVEVRQTTTDPLPLCAVAGAARVLAGEPPLADVAPALPSLTAASTSRAAPTAALAAACALLLATTVGLLWRANAYDAAATRHEAALREAFAAAFPSERPPLAANIRRRLEIEAERAAAGGAAGVAGGRSALESASRVLAALPADVRFRLATLEVTPTAITLDGQVRALGDVDRLAAALRGIDGLTVAQPATPQVGPRSVEFLITANATAAAAADGEGRP